MDDDGPGIFALTTLEALGVPSGAKPFRVIRGCARFRFHRLVPIFVADGKFSGALVRLVD
jgi:hypothetical protein